MSLPGQKHMEFSELFGGKVKSYNCLSLPPWIGAGSLNIRPPAFCLLSSYFCSSHSHNESQYHLMRVIKWNYEVGIVVWVSRQGLQTPIRPRVSSHNVTQRPLATTLQHPGESLFCSVLKLTPCFVQVLKFN